jgi:hypothetical protein
MSLLHRQGYLFSWKRQSLQTKNSMFEIYRITALSCSDICFQSVDTQILEAIKATDSLLSTLWTPDEVSIHHMSHIINGFHFDHRMAVTVLSMCTSRQSSSNDIFMDSSRVFFHFTHFPFSCSPVISLTYLFFSFSLSLSRSSPIHWRLSRHHP